MFDRLKNVFVVLVIFIFISWSCNRDSEKKSSENIYSLVANKEIDIEIDSTISVDKIAFNHFTDTNQQEFLYLTNINSNIVSVIRLQDKKLVKKIRLEKEGPNGVGMVNALLVISPDSICVLSSYTYRLSLINNEGRLLRSYYLLSKKASTNQYGMPTGDYWSLVIGDNLNYIAKYRNKLFMGAYPGFDNDNIEFYRDGKSGVSVDLKDATLRYLIDYPKSYEEAYKKGWRFPGQYVWSSQTFNPDKGLCVFSFPADKNLYVLDVNTGVTKQYEVKSRYFSDIKLHHIKKPTADQNYKHCIENHQYERIYYDKYRKIYIRYCAHPNEKKHEKLDNHPFIVLSAIILNDKFEKIGETLLDEKFGGGYMFFCPDGIYIRSLSKDEDHITFTRFDLAK